VSEELNHIDDIFSDALSNARIEPPAGVWEAVSSNMSGSVATQTSVVWFKSIWLWVGVSALSIAGVVAIQRFNQSESVNRPAAVVAESSKSTDGSASKSDETKLQTNINSEIKDFSGRNESDKSKSVNEFKDENMELEGLADFETETKNGSQPVESSKMPLINGDAKPATKEEIARKPCVHSISITAEETGENTWKFIAKGTTDKLFWSVDNHTAFEAGSVMSHTFQETEGIHFVYLKGKNLQGCDDTARTLVVLKKAAEAEVFIPDYLTPNADGINDELKVTVGSVTEYNLLVFDKNNRQVFLSNTPGLSWAGKAGLIECEAGMYKVVLSYKAAGSAERKIIRKTVWLNRGEN
jgi:hypothetical protein